VAQDMTQNGTGIWTRVGEQNEENKQKERVNEMN
jgi:hypothetical protein